MKIKYTNNGQTKMPAYVYHGDKTYEILPNKTLELKVAKGDAVSFRVGRFNATHGLHFQSPEAEFLIAPNKRLQILFIAAMLVLIGVLYTMRQINTVWLTVVVVVALVGYEALIYLNGFQATPLHRG